MSNFPGTNLQQKFDELGAQITVQHNEIMARTQFTNDVLGQILLTLQLSAQAQETLLTSIKDAVTLADLHAQDYYADNNALLTNLINLVSSNNTASMTFLASALGRIYQAIRANDPCACNDDPDAPPLLPPDPDPTISTADAEHCRRAQAMLDMLGKALQMYETLSVQRTPTNWQQVNTYYKQFVSIGGPVSLSVSNAQIISDRVNDTSFNLLGVTNKFNSMKGALRDAIYSASSAAAVGSLIVDILSASLDSDFVGITLSLFDTSVLNRIYNDTYAMNTAGYSGSLCTGGIEAFPPQNCVNLPATFEPEDNRWIIHWPEDWPANTAVNRNILDANLGGYTLTPLGTEALYYVYNVGPATVLAGFTAVIPSGPRIYIITNDNAGVRLCPPGSGGA